jgi:hypothetical protein
MTNSVLTMIASYKANRSVNCVKFSPTGKLIALALSGGEVHIINIKGEKIHQRKFIFYLYILFLLIF